MKHPADTFVRPVEAADFDAWLKLWDGYNAFYGRTGETSLEAAVTRATWARFFDAAEPVHALVATCAGGDPLGLAHYLFHRSTTRIGPVCYLQDLYTAPEARGRGVATALLDGVYRAAAAAGAERVYWQTRADNHAARRLYDRVAVHAGFIVYAHEL